MRKARDVVFALFHRMTAHHTLLLAAGVAFMGAISLVPALVTVVAFYGIIASPSDVETNVRGLVDALPESAADLIVGELEVLTATSDTSLTLGLVAGLIGSAWAITAAVNSLVIAIRVAREIPSPHNWLQGRVFALALSTVAVLFIVTLTWLTVALPRVLNGTSISDPLESALVTARWPIVVVSAAAAVAVLFRVVVGHWEGRFGISVGSVWATIIWVLSTVGLDIVVGTIGRLQSTFTTLGAVAGWLAWCYLTALAVLVGAELDGAARR